MSLLRRRKIEVGAAESASTHDENIQSSTPSVQASQLDLRIEALTTRIDEAMVRIDRMEAKMADLADSLANLPSHSDVLEVRLHSAKLAAELARSTVELRGEIGMASDEARRAARLARSGDYETGEVPVSLPVDVDLSEIKPIDEKPKANKKRRTA